MGSPCSFTRQQALKMGYFYWLCVKNSNHLHTEISLGYLKDTKFYLESKAVFLYLRTLAPKNFPHTDFFKTLIDGRK